MAYQDFINYIETTFFKDSQECETNAPIGTIEDFKKSLFRPLRKTIRLNYNQVDPIEFITRKSAEGWSFTPTPNPRVFGVDRVDRTLALGSTPEHLRGDFYIQELSASMAVHILTDGLTDTRPLRILEMASSPGGKTTQLAEHYPASFIVANEFTKDRLNALLDNIERMRALSIGVSGLNGVQFRHMSEAFDRVLLDAPCSGEGIGFKAEESLKYWNIKNVRTIARLQAKLLIAGLTTLRVGGELLYSTCTLNLLENEWVLAEATSLFGDSITILSQKRFWPHLETAGGFFVARIIKVRAFVPEIDKASESLIQSELIGDIHQSEPGYARTGKKSSGSPGNSAITELNPRSTDQVARTLQEAGLPPNTQYQLYAYKEEVRYVSSITPIDDLLAQWYCLRLGVGIGRITGDHYEPNLKNIAHLITKFDQK
jgi:16S rRNA C967 or C1407 C5-methylase (RsmB/RsmF family)